MRNFFKRWRQRQSREDATLYNYSLMQRWMFGVLMLTFLTGGSQSQLFITVTDKDTKEAIPFANVVLYSNSVQVAVATTDFDGHCKFNELKKGTYGIKAVYVGYESKQINAIALDENSTRNIGLDLNGSSNITCCEIITYCHPTISNGFSSGATYTRRNGKMEHCGVPDGSTTAYINMCSYTTNETTKRKKDVAQHKTVQQKLEERPTIPDTSLACLGTCLDSILAAEKAQISSLNEQNLLTPELNVYPNPCKNYVRLQGTRSISNVALTDLNGKILKQEVSNGTNELSITTSELANGVYFIKGTVDDQMIIKKIIIQN